MNDRAETDTSYSSLDSITNGAGLFFVGKGCYQIIEFLTNLILTRTLGTSLYGIYAYLRVIFSLFRVATRLGGDKAMLRFLPEYEEDSHKQRVMLTLAYTTSIIASFGVALGIYFLAPVISEYTLNDSLFIDVLRIAALILPFNTLSNITFSAFKGIERMDYNVAVSSVIQPTLRLVFVGGAVLLGYSLVGAVAGFVVSGILGFIVGFIFLRKNTDFSSFESPSLDDTRQYYSFSFPLIFNQLGHFLYNRVDILMVGFLLTGAAVGVYNIAVMVAGILALPLTAFTQLFPPIASRLYHGEDWDELESVYSTVTRWIFSLSLFPGIVAIVYANEVLQVFGDGFTRGTPVLTLFVIAQLTNCAVGPSGFFLMMTDHHYLTMLNQLSSGLVNVVLNYVFIMQFGFIGAAVATATVLAGINVIRVLEVWYIHEISPYNIQYYKPILAGAVSALVLYLCSLLLSNYLLIAVGGIAGGLVFISLLYILGIENEERALLNRIWST